MMNRFIVPLRRRLGGYLQDRELIRHARSLASRPDAESIPPPPPLPSANEVLIACVSEPHDPWASETVEMFRTLRTFGGHLANAHARAYIVGGPDATLRRDLQALDVSVETADVIDPAHPHVNKLAMLSPPDAGIRWLVALDTDVLIARDFSAHLGGSSIRACVADVDPLTAEQWHLLFARFGLRTPTTSGRTTVTWEETHGYFNSGVLVIPTELIVPLRDAWLRWIRTLQAGDHLQAVGAPHFYTDQYALTLALAETGLPFDPLPLEMNVPMHSRIHSKHRPHTREPYLLHHHHHPRDTRGRLLPTGYRRLDAAISRISLTIVQGEVAPFDNRSFWEKRYRNESVLGSGIGSRGRLRQKKESFIRTSIRDYSVQSVLDIGCGDIETMAGINVDRYLGIDLSAQVIDRNSRRRPEWNFAVGDALGISATRNLRADLVVCLDLLIHQPDLATYRQLVQLIVASTERVALVSGFEWAPRPAYSSAITTYHEPLTLTLAAYGARHIHILSEYRDLLLVRFEPASTDTSEEH